MKFLGSNPLGYLILILIFLYFIWLSKEIFFPIFLGIIIGLTIQNLATLFYLKTKINFYLLILVFYITLASFFIFLFYSLFKIVTIELPNFISSINTTLKDYNLRLEKLYQGSINFLEITRSYFPNFFSFVYSLFGNFVSFLLIFVISFYVAINRNFEKNIFSYFSEESREKIFTLWFRIKRKLSFWILGQLTLMIAIGLATYIIYGLIFDLPYKLLIAVTAGILEALPIIGPILTTVMASFIAFIERPDVLLFLLGSFFLIQQIENHFLVPMVMKNAVQLNPILVLFGLLVFSKFFGFWGTISVLPILVILTESFKFYFEVSRKNNVN